MKTIDLERERRLRGLDSLAYQILDTDPNLAKRALDCKKELSMSDNLSVTLRIPQDIIDRIERLKTWLQTQPEFTLRKASTAGAVNYILLKGLDAVEREAKE